jgi:outer membrane protein assembly factor BamD
MVRHGFLRSLSSFLLCAVLAIGLAACASDETSTAPEKPPEDLYNSALKLLEDKEYEKAAKQFEEVERQHPYSQWATRAQVMAAYTQYQALNYDDAVTAIERFIALHPGNNNIAYAYYLRALCYYERITDVRRDQATTGSALSALSDVISRFPDTSYAKDAMIKMSLVTDHMAGQEMEIGRYYLNQKLYIAAIGRFRTVVEKYQTTSHVPEALHRLVECYISLGIKEEAKATAAVLGHNFPGSSWYNYSYELLVKNNLAPEEQSGSWIGKAWKKVF